MKLFNTSTYLLYLNYYFKESYHKVYSREFVKYTKTGEKSNLLQKYEAHLRDDYQRTNAANLKTGLERTVEII